jgi:hypothetical protein
MKKTTDSLSEFTVFWALVLIRPFVISWAWNKLVHLGLPEIGYWDAFLIVMVHSLVTRSLYDKIIGIKVKGVEE